MSFLFFIFTVVVVAIWVTGMAFIFSTNEITPTQNLESQNFQNKDVIFNSSTKGIYIFMFIGIIWVYFWICDQAGFVSMVSASTYYFSSSQESEGSAQVLTGLKYTYFKHNGSLAFGALVHTIITIIKMMVDQAADQARKDGEVNAA
jgi:hypothetical protein